MVSPNDLAACLRVLAALAERPDDADLDAVRQAVDQAYRADKKRRKVRRLEQRREHDRALLATTARFREHLAIEAAPKDEPRLLRGERRCYVCKCAYRQVDADYHMLCPECAEENSRRRHARCDLTGRRAIVTGGRIKIGFHTAVKLLRDGAEVLVISSGLMTMRALEAAQDLAADKIGVAVLHCPTIKPLDEAAIVEAVRYKHRLVVVAENHSVIGGLGEAVASTLLRHRVQPAAFQLAGLPDAFLDAGALPTLHDRYGISRSALASRIKDWLV